MDNLTKYINKYGKISKCWPFEYYRVEPATDYRSSYLALGWDDNWEWDWKEWFLEIPRLISKEYGFIKWLTKNDYIDRDKIDELKLIPTLTYQNMMDDCDCGKSHWHPYTFVSDEDELLMLLAINKNPIEFLISVLK